MQCTYVTFASVAKLLDRSLAELKLMMVFLVLTAIAFLCLGKYMRKHGSQRVRRIIDSVFMCYLKGELVLRRFFHLSI